MIADYWNLTVGLATDGHPICLFFAAWFALMPVVLVVTGVSIVRDWFR